MASSVALVIDSAGMCVCVCACVVYDCVSFMCVNVNAVFDLFFAA